MMNMNFALRIVCIKKDVKRFLYIPPRQCMYGKIRVMEEVRAQLRPRLMVWCMQLKFVQVKINNTVYKIVHRNTIILSHFLHFLKNVDFYRAVLYGSNIIMVHTLMWEKMIYQSNAHIQLTFLLPVYMS